MNKRPLSVTIVSCLLAAAGAVGLVYHSTEFKTLHPFPYNTLWVSLVRVLAIVAGVFMLRGSNWARWLAAGVDRIPCGRECLSFDDRIGSACFDPRGVFLFPLASSGKRVFSW